MDERTGKDGVKIVLALQAFAVLLAVAAVKLF
jgi:hypothetical protein